MNLKDDAIFLIGFIYGKVSYIPPEVESVIRRVRNGCDDVPKKQPTLEEFLHTHGLSPHYKPAGKSYGRSPAEGIIPDISKLMGEALKHAADSNSSITKDLTGIEVGAGKVNYVTSAIVKRRLGATPRRTKKPSPPPRKKR